MPVQVLRFHISKFSAHSFSSSFVFSVEADSGLLNSNRLLTLISLDAPVACSISSSKTSNTLERDLDLLASVPSPSSSVSRKVSLGSPLRIKNILKRAILITKSCFLRRIKLVFLLSFSCLFLLLSSGDTWVYSWLGTWGGGKDHSSWYSEHFTMLGLKLLCPCFKACVSTFGLSFQPGAGFLDSSLHVMSSLF